MLAREHLIRTVDQVLRAVPGFSDAAIRAGMKAKKRVRTVTAMDTKA